MRVGGSSSDLSKRVGRIDVELVGFVDDDDAPAVGGGAVGKERAQPAHLVDGDRGGKALRLHVVGAADEQQPGMRQHFHLPRGARRFRDRETLPRCFALLWLRPKPRGRTGRRASPCRCPAVRSAARRDANGRWPAPRPAGARPLRDRRAPSSRADAGSLRAGRPPATPRISAMAGARAITGAAPAGATAPPARRRRRRRAPPAPHR